MGTRTPTQQQATVGADDRSQTAMRGLVVGAIGVVFGDLGTSPLYTMKEAFYGPHGMPVGTLNILGILSLVTWTLVMVVAVKYVAFIKIGRACVGKECRSRWWAYQ